MAKKLKTTNELTNKAKTTLAYQATVGTDRRRPVTSRTSNEGYILTSQRREIGSATARDDKRNMSILAWMVRRHLDNVSRFTPYIRLENDTPEMVALEIKVRNMLRWHGMRRNFDAVGRHGRDEFMRMFEGCKVIDGDAFALKVKGGKLQGIESDRVRKEINKGSQDTISESGIIFNADGTRKAFCVAKRGDTGTGFTFEKIVPAEQMIFDGYWPERFDSDRGVSPLLTALNEGADVRETWEWYMLKIKASGLFGFAITRTAADEAVSTTDAPPVSYFDSVSKQVKAKGLINLDMDVGDDIKAIESQSPNPNVMPFTREIIRSILLALDIPFTFYDSLTASFSARIADRNEYEEACEWKRDKNISVLDEIYGGWILPMWYEANTMGLRDVMDKAKISVEELSMLLTWIPTGKPWLDKSSEMAGNILELSAGLSSIPELCARYGKNAYEVAREQAKYLKSAQAPLLYANGGQMAVQAIMAGMNQGMTPKQNGMEVQTDEQV